MNTIITYTRKVPSWKIILGIGLFLAGIYSLLSPSAFNGIIFFVMSFVLIKTDGSQINLESNTYRKIHSFLGFNVGKWIPLTEMKYVSVFATTEDITLRALSAETTNSKAIILINLFYKQNKNVTIYATSNLKDAFNTASHIADALLIDILDATQKGNYRWVNKDLLREKGEIAYTD